MEIAAVQVPKKELSTLDLLWRNALGGALSCSFTHIVVVPLDVAKTRMQLSAKGTYNGVGDAFKHILRSEGAMGLLTGLGPTAVGYSLQGGFKFGFYDLFKSKISSLFDADTAREYRSMIYMGSGAAAEFMGDVALTPCEAVRIRLVSNPSYASGLISGTVRMAKEEGWGSLYKGFTPLVMKQIPYTVGQFLAFERLSELVYSNVNKNDLSGDKKLAISCVCGVGAGAFAAVVSHPPDTLLSKIAAAKSDASFLKAAPAIVKQIGFSGLWAGLGPRVGMVATWSALQFLIVDSVKMALGIPVGK